MLLEFIYWVALFFTTTASSLVPVLNQKCNQRWTPHQIQIHFTPKHRCLLRTARLHQVDIYSNRTFKTNLCEHPTVQTMMHHQWYLWYQEERMQVHGTQQITTTHSTRMHLNYYRHPIHEEVAVLSLTVMQAAKE